MSRIRLKPNSPEFAEKETRQKTRHCEMPGCTLEAGHKAPKDRGLNEYYNFCLEHVREYNSAWNFFSGMSNEEAQEHMINSLYGDRPTWRYDVDGLAEEALKRKIWQAYHFTEKEPPKKDKAHFNSSTALNRNTPEYEAMAIMGLEPPLSQEIIRARYRELAKKHHPDLNKGCPKSEEMLKQVNMAYTVLKLACEKFEKLPER